MNWKLWLMSKIAVAHVDTNTRGTDKSRSLPQDIGRHLVVERDLDPDWVWQLKYVRKAREGTKKVFDIRVFDPQDAAGKKVKITGYESLNAHPGLVLISGVYDKDNQKTDLDYSKIRIDS
jgi:hypothetical protein